MAESIAELQRVEQRIESTLRDVATCEDEAAADSTNPGAGLAHAIQQGLQRLLRRLRGERETAEKAANQAREIYRTRRMELRSLERLRERRLDEWRRELMLEEQKDMDEVARLRSLVGRRGVTRSAHEGVTRS